MQNNNKKFFEVLLLKNKIYLLLILILLVVICVENTAFIIPALILYVIVVGYSFFSDKKRKNEISETLQDLTITVDSAAKMSLINSPFPLIILDSDGKVTWRSSKFVSEFANIDIGNYVNEMLYDIRDEINKKEMKKDKQNTIIKQVEIGNSVYQVIGSFILPKNIIKK